MINFVNKDFQKLQKMAYPGSVYAETAQYVLWPAKSLDLEMLNGNLGQIIESQHKHAVAITNGTRSTSRAVAIYTLLGMDVHRPVIERKE